MNNQKSIVIGGGVGPMAGVLLHRKIIEHTNPGGTDQGHCDVYHISRSSDITDRTEFLLGRAKENPAEGMFRSLVHLAPGALTQDESCVVGIPCNTFHASPIWNRLVELIENHNLPCKLVHMIEETGKALQSVGAGESRSIGLFSTTGTRRTRVYHDILEPMGFSLIEVPESLQDELHDTIYNPEWGIKAVSPVSARARNRFESYMDYMKDQGVTAVILGCTEIPLVLTENSYGGIPLIDPMDILARALIRSVSPDKLKNDI